MGNVYSQIYLHIVFAVKDRASLLPPHLRPRVFGYMRGVLDNLGHRVLAIGGIENHVHILIRYNVVQSIPDTVKTLKTSTTSFINDGRLLLHKFGWQRGYYVNSHSGGDVDKIVSYILNQEKHHKTRGFASEMESMLIKLGIEFDPQYTLQEIPIE